MVYRPVYLDIARLSGRNLMSLDGTLLPDLNAGWPASASC